MNSSPDELRLQADKIAADSLIDPALLKKVAVEELSKEGRSGDLLSIVSSVLERMHVNVRVDKLNKDQVDEIAELCEGKTIENAASMLPKIQKILARSGGLLRGTAKTERRERTIGRNDPCHCGSGKKFKKCCGGRK